MTGTGDRVRTSPAPSPGVVIRLLDLSDPRWDVTAEAASLSNAERARAERGSPAVLRRRVLVRAGLRRVLGGLLGLAPVEVPLRADGGRPCLPGDELFVSCSASEDVAVLAVTDADVLGVDVQRHHDDEARWALEEGWLGDAELTRLRALPEAERSRATTRAWVQKEAVLKARGTGVVRLPVDIDTPVSERGRVAELHLCPVPVPEGYVASLATGSPVGPGLPPPVALLPGGRG